MNEKLVIDVVSVIAALARQAELWSRTPADVQTPEGQIELAARHERVKQFMRLVQVEADELRRAP